MTVLNSRAIYTFPGGDDNYISNISNIQPNKNLPAGFPLELELSRGV
jgi:hypothetical protein